MKGEVTTEHTEGTEEGEEKNQPQMATDGTDRRGGKRKSPWPERDHRGAGADRGGMGMRGVRERDGLGGDDVREQSPPRGVRGAVFEWVMVEVGECVGQTRGIS